MRTSSFHRNVFDQVQASVTSRLSKLPWNDIDRAPKISYGDLVVTFMMLINLTILNLAAMSFLNYLLVDNGN